MERNGILILDPLNAVWFAVLAIFIAVLVLVSILLRKKPIEFREKVLVIACLITFVGFFVYKYFLSIDPEFDEISKGMGMGGFNWWGELPLQLCNINMILIPIAILMDKRELKAFCFFVGPLGALMALMMPGPEFSGVSILVPRMLGYYGTHFMVMIMGLAIASFGLYKPRFKDLPRIVVAMLAIAFTIFMFDMILRWTGLYPNANYFFAVETEGNPILELFHGFLPYPFLYLLPCTLILVAYMAVVMLGFRIGDRISGKKEEQ